MDELDRDDEERIGLCLRCRWSREVRSGRGATFHRCELAGRRPGFEKYPRLPVLDCRGFEPRNRSDDKVE